MSHHAPHRTGLLLVTVLGPLGGCRDLIFGDTPMLRDTLDNAEPAQPDARDHDHRAESGFHSLHPDASCGKPGEPVQVQVRVETEGPVWNAPVAWRADEESPWTVAGWTNREGETTVQVPLHAALAVPGMPVATVCASESAVAEIHLPSACPVIFRVTDASGPVGGARIATSAVSGDRFLPGLALTLDGRTDARGDLRATVPCGKQDLVVSTEEGGEIVPVSVQTVKPAGAFAEVDWLTPPAIVVPVALGGGDVYEVRGVVTDADRRPVEGALVTLSTDGVSPRGSVEARTGPDGAYDLKLRRPESSLGWHLRAIAEGRKQAIDYRGLVAGEPATWNPVFEAGRWVEVRCVGRPNDTCDVAPRCASTPGDAPSGDRYDFTQVWCPADADVVYIGATAVRLRPGDEIAILDRRPITGGVHVDVTDDCFLAAKRSMAAMLIGGAAPDWRQARCGPAGCTIEELDPGQWEVQTRCGSPTVVTDYPSVTVTDTVIEARVAG